MIVTAGEEVLLASSGAAKCHTLHGTVQAATRCLVRYVGRTEGEEVRIRGEEETQWWGRLRRPLWCAPCWESGDPVSTQTIMLKMRMVKRVTTRVPLAHAAIDDRASLPSSVTFGHFGSSLQNRTLQPRPPNYVSNACCRVSCLFLLPLLLLLGLLGCHRLHAPSPQPPVLGELPSAQS